MRAGQSAVIGPGSVFHVIRAGLVPLTCWKCRRRRQERKELIMEIVETEMKYGRDLQIIHEEFYRPMLVAGLLTAEQLAGVFLNLPELRDWNRRFTDRLRDALEIALEHGDEDLLTVNLGALFREAAPMLHAFETYCLRQGTASVLLNSLEKEKELLRIFLKVSQMENTLLRRMDLSSFLMIGIDARVSCPVVECARDTGREARKFGDRLDRQNFRTSGMCHIPRPRKEVPVQRVTKYPLLLGRLYKVTPHRLEGREAIREAQKKIEAHLEHINALALDILEWSAENVCFAMEGRLSFTQAGDNMWTRRGKNVKLTPTYALLVIRGNLTSQYNPADADGDVLFFARRKGIEQAALLLARERNSRYALIRDPLMLDKCIVSSDTEVEGYFEVHDHSTKDTLYFKAESQSSSSMWFRVLQYHCHSLGNWRRRRNALANIMIDGMGIDKSH
ncbi:unnamed protein product [Notodromas monacha]|uniref:DH domain-containing protein n=1 Tax=Notodromas monacha TaxID=399045 RepID=A0A7R9G9I5_9CRUS|nr:unnamed protein product [Notodromas monacha]CAG0912652.1 unnamed protein product [Notodromas monacha]